MNPSPSAQNPISQPPKKANPNPFTTLIIQMTEIRALSEVLSIKTFQPEKIVQALLKIGLLY